MTRSGVTAIYGVAAVLCAALPVTTLNPGLASLYVPYIIGPLFLSSAAMALAAHAREANHGEYVAATLWLLGAVAKSFELWSAPSSASYSFVLVLGQVLAVLIILGGVGSAISGVLAARQGGVAGALQALAYAVLSLELCWRGVALLSGSTQGQSNVFLMLRHSQYIISTCAMIIGAAALWQLHRRAPRRLTMQ